MFMIVHAVLNFITPDTHTVWELITPNDNKHTMVNSSSPGQNGHLLTYDSFKCIFMNENVPILIEISLKCIPKGPIDNNPALV